MKRIINALKQIKLSDFLVPFSFLILLIPSWVFRLINKAKGRKLWLIAEQGDARDNGYHFYKYVREEHPRDYCFYAIKASSAGYEKVAKLGNTIKYGSLKHWLYYMSANLNISSQKSGNPCPIFWYFIHVTLGLYKNRVFLQHGITKDDAKWLYYNQTKFKYFICGAKKEYEYIKSRFGYPDSSVLLTGFPRWDALEDTSKEQKQKSILIMPTWRNWLGGESNKGSRTSDFKRTAFYKNWNGLLTDDSFINLIEKNGLIVYFYPHINMQRFVKDFDIKSKHIKVVSEGQEIQQFFNKCSLMVTDYSSVAFDFAYLNKPVIYYQFDSSEYRKKQYEEGYYDYKRDGFGDVLQNLHDVINSIEFCSSKQFKNIAKYSSRINDFFSRTKNNSEELYGAIR